MQVINSVLYPPHFTAALSETHMGLPRNKKGSWLWATLRRAIRALLAEHVTRGEGCRLQFCRLRTLSKKNFCEGRCAAPGRLPRGGISAPWSLQHKATADLMLCWLCSPSRRSGWGCPCLSLPAVLRGCLAVTPYPVLEQLLGMVCASQHRKIIPAHPLLLGTRTSPCCRLTPWSCPTLCRMIE